MKRELTLFFFSEPATSIAEDVLDNLSQPVIRQYYHCFHTKIHACIAAAKSTDNATLWTSLP